MTLRTKTTFYFCAGFLLVWTVISLLLFTRFKRTLLTAFDDQLRAKALLVANKTSIRPRVVPLPENSDLFVLLYITDSATDTLYHPATIPFSLPASGDSVATNAAWRTVTIQQSQDDDSRLFVIYASPADTVDQQIRQLTIFLWLVLPVGGLLSGLIAWYFSSRLLQPVRQVIKQANAVNLHQHITALPEPVAGNELTELVVSMNRMLGRIQQQAERQNAFFAAASHELRTPLSIMQTRLQVLLQAGNTDDTITELYNEQLQDVKQLAKMVNDFC